MIQAILVHLRRPRRAAGAVFAAAVVVTLLFQAALPAGSRVNENTDYIAFYSLVAHNILDGRGITREAGVPATLTPPGYPLILAGLFGLSRLLNLPEDIAILALACVAMGICSVLLYAVARSVWGAAPALGASLMWMTYPFALWLTKQPNSEIPFLVAFYGAFAVFWYASTKPAGGGWSRYFLSGTLIGAAALIRPIAIGAGMTFGAVLWLTRRDLSVRLRLGLIAALLLGNVGVVLPWEVWVYNRTGQIIPLATVGAESMRVGLGFAYEERWTATKVPAGDRPPLMEDALARSKQLNSSQDMLRLLASELRERPIEVGRWLAWKAVRSWYGTESGRNEAATLLIQAFYVPVVLWATVAAWRRRGTSRQLAVTVWVLVFYTWAMTSLVVPILRYMVPALGLLFVLVPTLIVRARAGSQLSMAVPVPEARK